MGANEVKSGLRVRVGRLDTTAGMSIAPKHLVCRKTGVTGTVKAWVPGHGGDVHFVQHDDSDDIGAYCYTELEKE